jgi:hypothetical protein
MKLSASRALLASLFAAVALSACSSGSSNNNTCTTASDCAAGDTCVDGQCLAPGQCASGILSCSSASQCGSGMTCTSGCCAAISGCSTSADCTTATKPHCDTTSHACVACANNTQCAAGKVCIASGACAAGCASDSNCSGSTPHCVTSGGFCAACTDSTQCPTSAPFCSHNACTGCTTNANCAAPTPVCDTSTKACVACLDSQNANGKNASCPAAKPACESGACVVCNPADNATAGSNGACTSATPSCGPASTCVACTLSSECAAGSTCGSDNTCTAVLLTGFAASAQSVSVAGTATFTATLNGDVTQPVTINVAISGDGGAQGTLSATTIVISSGHTGSVTYTAPASAGTANLTATLGATTLNASINVVAGAATLASVDLIGSSPVASGSTVMATVTLTAAPTSNATVVVTVNNGATINGQATANITVPMGSDISAPFTVQLACNTTDTTISATYLTVTKTATVSVVASAVSVLSLTASATTVASGQATTLTITLTGPSSCSGTPVTLSSSNVGFRTENKVNTYTPGTIVIPAGQTSASITVVPECSTNVTGDLIFFSAAVPGTQPVALSTAQALTDGGFAYTVAPIVMSTIAAGTVGLCPVAPTGADRPLTYVQSDGGLAPLPTVLTVGYFATPSSAGAYAVNLTANQAGGTVCGTFAQDGGVLPSGKLTLAAATKAEVTFLPSGVAGPCIVAAQGVGPDGGVYDAGIVSTLNLINYDWTKQVALTDLRLTKAEIDENNNKVGTLSDGGSIFGDATEYVEVFNGTSATIDLSQYTLVFVGSPNDNSTFLQADGGPAYLDAGQTTAPKHELWSFALTGMIPAGGYVIAQDANTFATAPNASTALLTWPDAGFAANVAGGLSATSSSGSSGALRDGNIANAPGGIFLVKNAGTANATIVDALTYGAPLQQAQSLSITGSATALFSWPPAPLSPLDSWITDNSFLKGSLVRIGYTGFPSLDWTDSSTVSPGAPNNVITGP